MPAPGGGDDDVSARFICERDGSKINSLRVKAAGQFSSVPAAERQEKPSRGFDVTEPARDINAFAAGPAALGLNRVLLLPTHIIDPPFDVD